MLRLARNLHLTTTAPSQKLITEDLGVVARRCNNYRTKASTIRKLTKKKKTKKKVNAGKQIHDQVQYSAINENTTQVEVHIPAKKVDKKNQDEP